MKFKEFLEENMDFFDDDFEEFFDSNFFTETIHELSAKAEVFPQAWGDVTATDPEEREKQAIGIYQRAKKMAESMRKKFKSLLKRVSQFKNSKVLIAIKPLDSFVDKAINRYPAAGKGASNITDVLRSAILVSDKEEVDKTVENIKKHFPVAKHKEKTPGSDPKYGYFGSHHFYVKIGEMLAEVQVMTRKLWAYKDVAHDIYNKYRGVKDFDKRMKKMDVALSKKIFALGNVTKKKGKKKGKPQLKKHKKWKFHREKLDY